MFVTGLTPILLSFFFASRRRHTRWPRDWSSDVCSSDLRRTHLVELGESEMGPLDVELVMHAGDVLFLRSGTPHQVETVGDYSLHLSFDLCDRAAGIETVFDLLLKRYDRDSLRPYGAVSEVLEKVASLGRTEEFRHEI